MSGQKCYPNPPPPTPPHSPISPSSLYTWSHKVFAILWETRNKSKDHSAFCFCENIRSFRKKKKKRLEINLKKKKTALSSAIQSSRSCQVAGAVPFFFVMHRPVSKSSRWIVHRRKAIKGWALTTNGKDGNILHKGCSMSEFLSSHITVCYIYGTYNTKNSTTDVRWCKM